MDYGLLLPVMCNERVKMAKNYNDVLFDTITAKKVPHFGSLILKTFKVSKTVSKYSPVPNI